jgi:protein-disulfide isomerase
MKRSLPFIIVAAVAFSAIGAGAAIYQTKKQRLAAATAVNVHDPAGAKPGAKPPHMRGSTKATVTIEEFADFQCPPCGGLSRLVKELEQKNTERLRVVFRHYPLKNHANAVPAALAAEAAGLQGKFWEMHDLLFKNQAAWSKSDNAAGLFAEYAASMNLDAKRFGDDMRDEKLKARVTADQERANSMGVSRTPSVFINGQSIPPEQFSLAALQTAIDSAAQGNKQASAQ